MSLLRLIAFAAAVLLVPRIAPASAEEAAPLSGTFTLRPTPCLLVKYSGGRPCDPPALPAEVTEQAIARIARAHFFADMQQLPLAVSEAEEALKLQPDNAEAHHLVARLALSIDDLKRAEIELNAALQLEPNNANIRATRAQLLQKRGTPAEAVRAYSEVLTLDPSNRFSRIERASIHMALREYSAAVDDLDVALEANSTDTILLETRATAYLALHDYGKAIADLDEYLRIDPMRGDALLQRANAFEMAGNDSAALNDLDAILGPIGGTARYALGGAEVARLRFKRAHILRRLHRHTDAAADAVAGLKEGGLQAILRAQTFLRQNGFPETPLDGRISDALSASVQACFGLNSCFEKLSDPL